MIVYLPSGSTKILSVDEFLESIPEQYYDIPTTSVHVPALRRPEVATIGTLNTPRNTQVDTHIINLIDRSVNFREHGDFINQLNENKKIVYLGHHNYLDTQDGPVPFFSQVLEECYHRLRDGYECDTLIYYKSGFILTNSNDWKIFRTNQGHFKVTNLKQNTRYIDIRSGFDKRVESENEIRYDLIKEFIL